MDKKIDIKILVWLEDVSMAIDEINSFFSDRPKVFAEFANDLRTKRAVERNIEIIGEATNRILKTDENIQITNARKIVNVRNQVIHNYERIDDETIWNIVINHLPLLRSEVEKLLSDNNTQKLLSPMKKSRS